MNKKNLIYSLLAALVVAIPTTELHADLSKQSEQTVTTNQQEITDNSAAQAPTISQTWGKVVRLKWTSLSGEDFKNIGLTFIAGAAAGCGIYVALAYEFAPSRYIPDYYPPTSNSLSDCPICIDNITPGTEKILSCGHTYCTTCLTQHIDHELKQKNTANMLCPDTGCRRKLSPAEIKYILNNDPAKMDAYYHIRLDEYDARHNYIRPNIDPASASWLQKNTKQCPACHTNIEKNGGCKHMTCKKCKHEFCWECLADWRYRTLTGHTSSSFFCPKANNNQFSGIA